MEEDIVNFLPTVMLRGTPCSLFNARLSEEKSDPLCKNRSARFTTVPMKLLSETVN